MATQIITRPIEIAGEHWVDISMDGRALKRRGPFADADAAEAMAMRLGEICRGLFHSGPIGVAPTPAATHKRREKHP